MHARTILLLVVLVAAPFAQSSWRPGGEYWTSLDSKEKSQLVHGMVLGLMMAQSYGGLTSEAASKLWLKMSQDEVVAAFVRFYAEPKNRKIPLEAAWMVEATRGAGVSAEVLAKLVEDLRAASSGKAPATATPAPTKHPEVYDVALNHADRSKKLKELFGEDIAFENERANAWALGPDQGDAYVFFDVTNGELTGRMDGHAKRVGGQWVYDSLRVLVIGTGDIVDLLADTIE